LPALKRKDAGILMAITDFTGDGTGAAAGGGVAPWAGAIDGNSEIGRPRIVAATHVFGRVC
jgi:hypothetical protein